MVARRLLVKDERGGETVVEVALESLLRQWDSLAQWLREQADDLKEVDNLDRAAADWERHGRNPEWLVKSVRLTAAEQLAKSPVFGARVRHAAEFLRASRERADAEADAERQRCEAELRNAQQRREEAEAHAAALRKRTRIQRVLLALTLVIALVAVVGLVLMFKARRDADEKRQDAVAGRLTAQAQAILSGGQPGSELEAIAKLLAAQHLSADQNIGALLTALSQRAALRRIGDAPLDATLSADGQRIATYTPSGVQLRNTETGQPISEPFADHRLIGGISPDGRYLAMISQDDAIRVWDSVTRQPIGRPMTGSEKAAYSAVSSDGRRAAAVDGKNTLRLWDIESGRQIGGPLPGQAWRTKVAFSPDGRRLASAGLDDAVRVWDASTGAQVLRPLRGGDPRMGEQDVTLSVAFSPDGHTIAAGGNTVGVDSRVSAGSPLRLWNADTGAPVGKPVFGNYGRIFWVALSPDNGMIVTGGSDKTVRRWDAHTGEPIGEPLNFQESVSEVAFTRDGHRIVLVSGETVQVLDADVDAKLPAEMGGSKSAQLADPQRGVIYRLATTPDGPRIVVVDNGTLRWLDAGTGEQVGHTVVSEALRGIRQYELSLDDRWLAVVRPDNSIEVVDAFNGQPRGGPIEMQNVCACAVEHCCTVVFSPDGRTLVTAGGDNKVRLWDWRSGRQIGEMTGHKSYVGWAGFSRDGRRLYSLSEDSIRIWDTTTTHAIGTHIGPDSYSHFSAMTISPDGHYIAAASSVSDERLSIQQWDADSGEAVRPRMEGDAEQVSDIAYSLDGRYLVSVCECSMFSGGGRLRFWDTRSGSQIGEPVDTAAIGDISDVEFSHDGRWVFATSSRVSVNGAEPFAGGGIWQLPGPAAWEDALCDKLTSKPSHKQWDDWFPPDTGYIELCPGKPDPPQEPDR
jgi:WD40 repeat protein